jgi:hypothetical protein
MFHPTRWLAWVAFLGGSVRAGLTWASQHTGLPVILVAAIALVTSWRIFRHSLRFAIEVALTATLLMVATKLGLLRW